LNMLSRRSFTKLSLIPLLATQDQLWADAKKPLVVDTHVHCFAGKDSKDFPYHKNGSYQPEVPTPPELLLRRMNQAGVDHAIIVHPEPYQDDHRYLEHCLKVGKKKLKGTCLFFATDNTSVLRMRDLVQRNQNQIVTLRFHAYQKDKLPPFGKPELRTLWQTAADLNLGIQLHFEPQFAAGFTPLIKEFSKTMVIIDHLGRPFDGNFNDYDLVLKWAQFQNTIVKISSLADPKLQPERNPQKVVNELIKRFTPERLIYGGGFDDKATGDSYRAYLDYTRSLLAKLSEKEQAMILGTNAQRLFKFES